MPSRSCMSPDKQNLHTPPHNLASLVRGLYRRVAYHLDVDPSYVSRVARGERQSEAIEGALEREMRQIMKMMRNNKDGNGGHTANHDGSNHDGAAKEEDKNAPVAKKEKMAVSKGKL